MDTVKASVNLGEMSVQLEGPQPFVEKYLEEYRSFLRPAPKRVAVRGVTKRAARAKRATAASSNSTQPERISCGKRITGLIEDGYFTEPRTSADVLDSVNSNGASHNLNQVCAVLSNLSKRGKLNRNKDGRCYQYSAS